MRKSRKPKGKAHKENKKLGSCGICYPNWGHKPDEILKIIDKEVDKEVKDNETSKG